MPSRYAQWMYDWEHRLTSVDNNRVVRPLEWGVEWARDWPCRNAFSPGQTPGVAQENPEKFILDYNQRIVAASDEFYSYTTPKDFRLETRDVQVFSTREVPDPKLEAKVKGTFGEFLRFTSPVRTPYPENDLVNARWFPARGRRAVILLPHWNADAVAYVSLCRVMNMLGIAVLRLTMPYHDIRMPPEISRADYAVSANIGRTLDAVRQGVVDIRSCLDWLEKQGYSQFGIVGTSLGSCYAFIAAAHEPRLRVAAFNHASTYVADVVWHGQSTRHIRQGIEQQIDRDLAAGLAGGESDVILQAIHSLAEEVADRLCEIRSDVSARTLKKRCRGVREARARAQSRGPALRALHYGRNALQIHGRLATAVVSANGFLKGAFRTRHSARQTDTRY